VTPTTILSAVMARAANTELAATARFSARIACELNSESKTAGVPHMTAIIALSRSSAKPEAAA